MTYDRLYQKLEIKGDEKEVFKLAKARKRRIRGLGDVRCFKDEDGKDLDEEAQVKEIWQRYCSELFNSEVLEDSQKSERGISKDNETLDFVCLSARMRLMRP